MKKIMNYAVIGCGILLAFINNSGHTMEDVNEIPMGVKLPRDIGIIQNGILNQIHKKNELMLNKNESGFSQQVNQNIPNEFIKPHNEIKGNNNKDNDNQSNKIKFREILKEGEEDEEIFKEKGFKKEDYNEEAFIKKDGIKINNEPFEAIHRAVNDSIELLTQMENIIKNMKN